MKFLARVLINMLAVFICAYFLPGVRVEGLLSCFLVAFLLGVVNSFLKPFLKVLTLPLNILTLGLFSLFLNALIILLIAEAVIGFRVDGFLAAFLFSIILSLVSSFLSFFLI